MTERKLPSGESEPVGHLGIGRSAASLTSIDQILSSVSNALLLLTVAQTASVSEFGIIALLVAIVAVWTAFNRGALGAPLLLISNLTPQEIRVEAGYAVTWAATTGIGAAVSVCGVGAVADELANAILFAAAIPAVMIQDTLRFAAISCGQPLKAVLSDGLWAILVATAFISNTVGAGIPAGYAVGLWGLSGLLATSLIAFSTGIRPRSFRILNWWKTYARARIHFGMGDALSPVYTVAVLFAVTTIVDSAVAGTLRGATTLFGPIALLFSALPLVFVPHARRSMTSPRRQWQLLVKMSWLSSALTAAATAVAVTVPHSWGIAIMGATWDSAVTVMPYEGIAVVAAIWMASVYVFLKMQGKSRAAFWLRLLQIGAQFAGSVVAAILLGTAVAIAALSAGLCWLTLITSVTLAGRVAKTAEKNHRRADSICIAPTIREPDSHIASPTSRPRRSVSPDPRTDQKKPPWPTIDVLEVQVLR